MALGVWGGWMGVGRWLGGIPHTCAHTHTHAHVVNMIISCEWQPPLGESLWCHMHVCMRVHMHMCGGTLSPPPTHIHPPPPPPRGDPQNQSKFNSTWTNQDISIQFEDLKSVETSPPMGGCMVSWVVGGWVDGWGQVKTQKIVDWIKIIQFCLKIYDL